MGYSEKILTRNQLKILSELYRFLYGCFLFRKKLTFKYFYYKNYEKAILLSDPIVCDRSSEYETHMFTCKQDALCAMWCLKTFFHYSGLRIRLVIHDNGTLTDDIIQKFLTHFVGCEIIRKRDADIEMRKHLRGYPFSSKFRFDEKEGSSIMSIRLFDFPIFSKTKKILNLDSDILFFKKPIDIIEYMKNQKGFFMSDYQNAYSLPVDELNKKLDLKFRNKVNAGIFYIPGVEYYDLNLLESFIKMMYECHYPISGRIEQTGFAMLFSKYREAFVRLPDSYQISKKCITEETISHHFVNDGSRTNFYKEGLKHLKQIGFFGEFNKTY